MKKVITITAVLMLIAAVSIAKDSAKGGSVAKGEGFKIDVPTMDVKMKQGETQTITIKVERGESFKQDVTLAITAEKGLGIEPAKVLVKASDKPEVVLTITVPKGAALGKYKISVTGKPTTGEPTTAKFKVKVIAS
jgi:uncharacterized membrane protein